MKRKKTIYDKWLRTLFLSFALLTGGGVGMAWGQETTTRPVISLMFSEDHDKVHVKEEIIYVDPTKPRVLSIPVLNVNTRNNNDQSYNWFVHWYVKNGDNFVKERIGHHSVTVTKNMSANRGGSLSICNENSVGNTGNADLYITHDYFIKVKETDGLIWSNRLKDSNVIPEQTNGILSEYKRGLGIDASTIVYTLPEDYADGDVVYCDVSVYQDGTWTPSSSSDIKGTYAEPTLLKRYKYVIKKAEECPSYIQEKTIYHIDFPKDAESINLSMPYTPDNYFWNDGKVHQGSKFQYRINSDDNADFKDFHLVTRKADLDLQQTQKIEINDALKNDFKVDIRAICNENTPHQSGVIATFNFHPIENAKFILEDEINKDSDRWPRGNIKKYKQIGIVDFDQNSIVNEIQTGDNMSNNPLGSFNQSETSYGFIYKNGKSLLDQNSKCYTSYPGMYGLFRSANVEGKSKHDGLCSTGDVNRYYKWVTPYIEKAYNYGNKIYENRELYDRTYTVTKEAGDTKYGYFCYIDATDEPGTLVSVPIEGSICGNTELTVTGWLADMTRPGCDVWADGNPLPLVPNLNIILKGVKGQEEVVLHRFTTGDALTDYKDNKLGHSNASNVNTETKDKFNYNLMKWQQFHYKFVVSEDEIAGCTEFYLEVQNNEPHTDGADYAIDDIRIFKRKPEVEIIQAGDLCDTELKTVKYATSYSNIMSVMGLTANTKVEGINKDVEWDDKLPQELKDYISEKYPNGESDAVEYFTKIYYSVYAEDNLNSPIEIDYDGDGIPESCRVSYLSTRKEDMKWVDSSFGSDGKTSGDKIYSLPLNIGESFDPNKKYIARISAQPIGHPSVPVKCDACALTGDPFSISLTGDRFKIFEGDDLNTEISSPENAEQGKRYKIAGNFRYLGENGWETVENAKFDWFIGDVVEFNASTVTVNSQTYTIAQALREISTNPDGSEVIKNALTTYGEEYCEDNARGKFVFSQPFFEYTMANKYQTIIGLPQAQQKDGNGNVIDDHLYCPDPVVIQLGPNPPTIEPGDPNVPDPEDSDDPQDPEDPDPKDPEDPNNPNQPDDFGGKHVRSVRVGLVQIRDMQQSGGTLRIPIHLRKSADGETFAKDTKTDITILKTSDTKWNKSKSVATLEELVDDATTVAWTTNYFKIKFTSDAVNNFKEGFWYMVDIPYVVKDKEDKITYSSSFQLTLKIVPEYVTWVGSTENMHNWNNDGPKHWRRSTDNELYTMNIANKNGEHTEAYTPMRFTKVTIHGKAKDKNGSYSTDGNAYAAYPYLYRLSKRTTAPAALVDMAPAGMDATIGAATKNIEYDLLADPDYERELFGSATNPDKSTTGDNHNYSCVRFYGNICDEIYIKPESEILHTEYLTYNTARVDYEMAPNRWYMLASPLKGVVSGDMYLPTGTETPKVGSYARQETPAFTDITYVDNTNYSRWKPAVYMRGWDKATATVVRPDGTKPNYGITGSWSNLYNDVDVPFTPGTGFSIGTKTDRTTTLTNDKVLFRLPKVDTEYTYYGSSNGTEGDKTKLTNREDNGRFHISPDEKGQKAVTSCSASSTGGMFGNPFMSHLDMTKFLQGKSQKTYYIMTATGTTTNILGDEYSISTGDADPKFVAPLQSFIVKDLASATFTTDMIAKAPTTGKLGLRSATVAPAEESLPQLRITATRDGIRNTAVVAGLATASDSYVEGEDAALLINEEVAAPQVYTLAGNQMVAINVTPDLAEIPVGIHGKDATPVELSFKLSGAMKNVKLVDKQTGKRYDVTDGLTLTVPGNTYGRYFLNGSIATSNEIIAQGRIIFYNSAPGRIDVSSVDALSEVTVYDISGRALRTLRNLNTPTVSVDHLAPGIYVVRAESGSQVVSEKVEVK